MKFALLDREGQNLVKEARFKGQNAIDKLKNLVCIHGCVNMRGSTAGKRSCFELGFNIVPQKFTEMLLNFTSASSQPAVLFLHGFLGNHTEFHSVSSRLEQFNCMAIDLPGHGKTQETWEYSLPNTAEAIVELLTQAQIDQANLVGYSMGGRLALYLALTYPDRFPKVVIESGSPGLKTARERSQRIQHDHELANRLEADFQQFLRDWYNMPLFRSFAAHPNFEQIVQERAKNNPLELARSLREMGTGMQPSLWKTLESHRQPILLIVGECDRKFIEINQEMAALCPTAELVIVSDCGHNVHFEKPEEFVDRLQHFLLDSQSNL